MQENYEIFKGILKKKKSSENEKKKKGLKMTSQLVIFRAFFLFFSCTPDPKSEKNPVKQLIKKSGLIDPVNIWKWASNGARANDDPTLNAGCVLSIYVSSIHLKAGHHWSPQWNAIPMACRWWRYIVFTGWDEEDLECSCFIEFIKWVGEKR